MKDYLTSQGWPNNLSNETILQDYLQPMYRKLEGEGFLNDLKKQGFNYQQFVDTAARKFQEIQMFEAMQAAFRRR